MASSDARPAVAAVLADAGIVLAAAVTERLYTDFPHLAAKYGDAGRARCLEDISYTIEHLATAVSLGEPGLFVRYVLWLRELLLARDIPTTEIRRSLELIRELAPGHLDDDGARAMRRGIDAGLAELDRGPAA